MAALTSVLVTGASTGIGAATVIRLAERGCLVFAGVRNLDDGEKLRSRTPGVIEPLLLDVTDPGAIAAAVDTVAGHDDAGPLAGVVNNAGIAFAGPVEYQPLDEWREHLDVNVVGAVAVTQAFLPLVRRARGRIVFVGSVGGRVSTPLLSAYCASKFALEAVALGLAGELRPVGVGVSIVEPGPVRTPIWDKSVARAKANMANLDLPAEAGDLYGMRMEALQARAGQAAAKGISPERVADTIVHALFGRRHRLRYPVGPTANMGAVLSRVLPDRLVVRLAAR